MDRSEREYDEFVRSRTPALLRLAYLLTGDQHLAEDLVQSALARTHQAWPRLRATGDAEAYARRTMYRRQVSWWRRRLAESRLARSRLAGSRRARVSARVHSVGPGYQAAVRATLRQALLQLTASQRAVLVLRFYERRSVAETAEILGVSVGTVKSQTARALSRLRAAAPELADLFRIGGAR